MKFKLPNASDTMHARRETIHPVTAQDWLNANYDLNRPLRWSWVEQLAARMTAGHWKLTHQGVAFDTDGRLIDGQHRLWAITVADMPVDMMVTRGVSTDTFGVLDQHRVRSVSDLAGDRWITPRIVGIARAMARGVMQGKSGAAFDDRDPTLILQFIQNQRAIIETVLAFMPTSATHRGRAVVNAVVQGCLCRASLHVPIPTLQRFVNILIEGNIAHEGENAALLLRDTLLAKKTTDRSLQYQKTQRAIAAVVAGDPIKTLLPSPDDLYPLNPVAPRPALRKVKGSDRTEAQRSIANAAKKRAAKTRIR